MSCTRDSDPTSAKLCAVLNVLADHGVLHHFVSKINTDLSGTTPAEIYAWFNEHIQADTRVADIAA